MSESRQTLYKIFTWLFLAGLIGVYALYDWYTGTLNRQLTEQGASLSETTRRLVDTEQRLKTSTASEQSLSARLAAAESGLQSTTGRYEAASNQVDTLTKEVGQYQEEIAALKASQEGLQAQVESMGAEHEATSKELTGRLERINRVHTELEVAHQASQKHRADLEEENARLKEAIAEADERYAAKAKRLEERMRERVNFYRTALEGSEPERAALMTQLEQHANEDHTALEQQRERQQARLAEAEQAHQAAEAELTARLTEAQQQAEARSQALTATEEANQAKEANLAGALAQVTALTAEVQQGRDALTALEQKYERQLTELRTELEQAGETLAGVQGALSAAIAANTEQKDAHQDRLKAAEQRIAELERDLAAAQSRPDQALAEERDKAQEALAAAQTKPGQTPAEDSSRQESAVVTGPLKAAPAPTAALSTPQSTQEPTPTGEQSPTAVQAKTEVPAQTEGLPDRYAELKATQTGRGMLVVLGDDLLHFQTGGAAMPKGKVPSLERIGALLVAFPNLTARIEGYTDSSGADQTNLALSKARAEAVRTALIARGIAPERLTAEGLGKQRPVAENGTPAGRRKNRRIEVYLIEATP